ncbi:tyrosine-type recombinase/integrase [Klebsiella pneumoniae]|nr:tyrosine-type recombinase/integrase [Klebsiella pneumoniae]
MPPACVSELVGLTMSDISLRQESVLRIGGEKATKSGWCRWGKRRYCGWKITSVWSPWLLNSVASDVLFPSQRAQQMTRQTFWHRIKHYAVLAGIDSKSFPACYAMRSPAFAQSRGADLAGADAVGTQRSLHHADATTWRPSVCDRHQQHHPRA